MSKWWKIKWSQNITKRNELLQRTVTRMCMESKYHYRPSYHAPGFSVGSAKRIVDNEFGFKKVAARWVSKMLMAEQTEIGQLIFQANLARWIYRQICYHSWNMSSSLWSWIEKTKHRVAAGNLVDNFCFRILKESSNQRKRKEKIESNCFILSE